MKAIRILLATVTLLLCSIVAMAEEVRVDGITYNLNLVGKTATVISSSEGYSGVIVIPEAVEYNGGKYSVTTIGSWAFFGCTGLTSVTIGNSVTEIGSSAFEDCTGLTAVHINDLSAWCNIDFKGGQLCNPLSYADNLYLNGELVTDLVIPSDVTEIKSYVFFGCTGLESVTIGSSVTTIGNWAFSACTGLTSIYLMGDVPPIVDAENFTTTQYENVVLYVPKGTLATYQAANVWNEFKNIQEFDTGNIKEIATDE